MHWDPLRDLVALQDRMNRLFDEAAHARAREDEEGEMERADWTPAADVYHLEDEYLIVVDLPGVERARLDISVEHDRLLIRGERQVEKADGQQRRERPHGRFLRKFGPLPQTIDQRAISAAYKDGVLTLHLPKQTAPPQQRVEIKVT